MDKKLESMNEHVTILTARLGVAKSRLQAALDHRKAYLESLHTWTAKDYRIVLIQDEYHYSFDDIEPEPPTEDDSQEFKDRYQALYDAYHHWSPGGGIYALVVDLQKRDVETGEFESVESCSGLFHLDSDSQKQICEWARDIASGLASLPPDIKFADIDVLSEEDAK